MKKRLKYKYSGPGRIQTDSDGNTNKNVPHEHFWKKSALKAKKKKDVSEYCNIIVWK